MKKITAIFMAILMLLTFASCKDNADNETTQPQTESEVTQSVSDIQTEDVFNSQQASSPEAESTVPAETEPAVENIPTETDPSKWTDEEVVAFYKAAAIRSKTKVKSTEYKNLTEMVVNDGNGFLGNLVEMVTPILISALEDSQVEFDGITGGYENLEVSDAESMKAYKSGEYTVIEMTMKDQKDGIHADRYSGTVGHAISVVGDISSVEEALPMLEIGFEEADIKLHYKNAKFKVKINKDGIIEKGTWSYDIYITVANLYVGGRRLPISATVEKAHGSVGYIITVGGGF